MTLTIPSAMQTALDSGFTTFCTLIRISRTDGVEFLFTDHDKNITFETKTYKSKSGFDSSSIQSTSGLSVDNLDFNAVIDDDTITTLDLKSGLFNGASVEVLLVDYTNLVTGNKVILKIGTLGDVTVRDNGSYYAEVRGLSSRLQNRIGLVYTPLCNARQLGDSRCGFSLTGSSFVTSVLAVTNNRTFTHNTSVQAAGYFNHGIIEWLGGSANNGYKMEVKSYTVSGGIGTFTLQLPMPKNILVADSFRAIRGCDRRFDTCKNTFNNVNNFRGYPHLPGLDEMLKSGV
jgi:uncharacterized phage protein (TIGR02218 family)